MRLTNLSVPVARAVAALGLTALALAGSPARAATTPMAAHHALYKLTMEGNPSGDVVSATGTMAYEVVDACDGWATRQRLEMTLTNREGQDINMVSDYATWEAKNGLSLRFHMRQTTDEAVSSETEGSATLRVVGGTGKVEYRRPEQMTKTLPAGTLFPMRHTEAIIAAAAAGKRFLAVPIFDGTVPTGAQDSFVVLLNWKGPTAAPYPALSELPSTSVRIAFFDRKPTAQTPDYSVAMRYWANGVADQLHMDFGDFIMSGKLTALKLLPKPHC